MASRVAKRGSQRVVLTLFDCQGGTPVAEQPRGFFVSALE